VAIDYAPRSCCLTGRIRFRHRLAGLDRDWVDAGQERRAYYSNLPPGRYRFAVMASNRDGFWNGDEATVSFVIRPPLYRTPLFFAACAALALGCAAVVHRLRVRQMRAGFAAVINERTRIARELHDTLAQGLAGVKLHIDAGLSTMADRPDVARRSLQCARSIATSSLSEVRRSIWVLRAQAAKGENGLASSFSSSLQQLTGDSGISTFINVNGAPRRLPVEVERNLLRIAHEAVTNAVRHSGAGTLGVELRFEASAVELRVRDDGRGFDADAYLRGPRGEHFGLAGMRERVLSMRGDLQIRSGPAQGTEILCRLPESGPVPAFESAEGESA
jgi:signal transduction histidine kinase